MSAGMCKEKAPCGRPSLPCLTVCPAAREYTMNMLILIWQAGHQQTAARHSKPAFFCLKTDMPCWLRSYITRTP